MHVPIIYGCKTKNESTVKHLPVNKCHGKDTLQISSYSHNTSNERITLSRQLHTQLKPLKDGRKQKVYEFSPFLKLKQKTHPPPRHHLHQHRQFQVQMKPRSTRMITHSLRHFFPKLISTFLCSFNDHFPGAGRHSSIIILQSEINDTGEMFRQSYVSHQQTFPRAGIRRGDFLCGFQMSFIVFYQRYQCIFEKCCTNYQLVWYVVGENVYLVSVRIFSQHDAPMQLAPVVGKKNQQCIAMNDREKPPFTSMHKGLFSFACYHFLPLTFRGSPSRERKLMALDGGAK